MLGDVLPQDTDKTLTRDKTDDEPIMVTHTDGKGYPVKETGDGIRYYRVGDGDNAKYYRDVYRRYRDYSILAFAVAYVLQVIDATVFAYMQDFEVSDDISMKIEPSVIPVNYATSFSVPSTPAVGMRIGVRF